VDFFTLVNAIITDTLGPMLGELRVALAMVVARRKETMKRSVSALSETPLYIESARKYEQEPQRVYFSPSLSVSSHYSFALVGEVGRVE